MSHNGGGWFAVSRTIFDHYVVGIRDCPYTELEAWLWLLAEAAFEPTKVVNKGQPIVIDPGQIMAAYAYLAKVWDWSPDKVRWFLKRLQNEAMITRWCATQGTNRNTNQIQILTICNYSNYQHLRDVEHQAKPQAPHQPSTKPAPSQHHEYKEDNLTTDNKKTPIPPSGADGEKSDRGTRLPRDWALPADWRAATLEQFDIYDAKITTEANAFRDYWAPLPGAKGRKTDWLATWRNWIRKNYLERQAATAPAPRHWWQDPEKLAQVTPEQWTNTIVKHANGRWPSDKLGPAPGSPGCVVPFQVVTELRLTEKYTDKGIKR